MTISNLTANPETQPKEFLFQVVQFLGEYFPVAGISAN